MSAVMLQSPVQNFGRQQLMTSPRDVDTDSSSGGEEHPMMSDSRSALSTPVIGPHDVDVMTDKQSPRPVVAPAQQTIASYWSALKEMTQMTQHQQSVIGGVGTGVAGGAGVAGGLDALLQKYGPGPLVEPPRAGAGGAVGAAAPFSMGLQLLQQCVEKSLTEAQKAPSLAPLGATHELRNPASAVNHRLPLVPIDSNDVGKMAAVDGQEESYSCHICSAYTTENYEDFRSHVTTHFEHQCEQCDYSSRTESRLKKHMHDVHGGGHASGSSSPPATPSQGHSSRSSSTKVFRCRQCSFVAPSKTDYWIHGRIHMRQDRMLQCPRCPFITEYKHHLEYHLRNHLGSKPFKCSKCNYACVNKSMLNSHMKSHTNVYQYRCMDCSYASKYCHSLKVHLEKTGHRPASILNPDGTLPAPDAAVMVTGSPAEAINRQMPIRRRKNGASATPISYADMAHTIGQASAAFAMAGQSPSAAAGGAWPLRQSSGEAPPPLIPIANMANMAASVGAGAGAGAGAANGRDFACTYCPFTTPHYVLFQQHLTVSHLAPMAMRAFPFGAVAPPQVTSPASRPYPSPHHVTPDFASARSTVVPGTGSFVAEGSGELSPRKRAYSLVEARAAAGQPYDPPSVAAAFVDDEDRKRSYSFAANRVLLPPAANYFNDPRYTGKLAVHGCEADEEEAGAQSSGRVTTPNYEKTVRLAAIEGSQAEQPLDLSGATATTSNSSSSSSKVTAGAPEQNKESGDSHLEEYMDVANSHLPPRKRCRKGKAYKLDMTAVVDDAGDLAATSPTGKVVGDVTPPAVGGDLHLVPSSPTADDLDLRSAGDATRTPPLPLDKKPGGVALPETLSDEPAPGRRRVSFDAESVEAGSYGSVGSPSRSLPEALDVVGKAALEARASGQGIVHECRHCDMAFGDYFMYMMHKGYHGYQDPFTCNICGERTNNKLDFFLHIARVAHG